MGTVKVWTVQHKSVAEVIASDGIYIPDAEHVCWDMGEYKELGMECYNWLARNLPWAGAESLDLSWAGAESGNLSWAKKGSVALQYPVWVTLEEGKNYPETGDLVLFELEVPADKLAVISVAKWSAIMDYRYIPADEEDRRRHSKMLQDYGTSDTAAYMSQFYPDIKREIQSSWHRVFEVEEGETRYGLIPCIKKDWLR